MSFLSVKKLIFDEFFNRQETHSFVISTGRNLYELVSNRELAKLIACLRDNPLRMFCIGLNVIIFVT